jgi:hypothetical protein
MLSGGLLLSGTARAQDNPWLTPENGQKMPEASAEAIPTIDVKVHIDVDPRPQDNGGNLFLLGFEEVDAHSMPLKESEPADSKQLGIWVQRWPFVQEVQLIEGLHYRAIYGYYEQPSPGDMMSQTVQAGAPGQDVLKLVVQPAPKRDEGIPKGTPPTDVEALAKIPEGLQDAATTITVTMEPHPTNWGGVVFLTGFAQFDDVLGMPPRGAEPDHFMALSSSVETFPLSESTPLKRGFAYFAMYGQGSHPEAGDRMSRAVVFEGGETLTLAILQQIVGKPPKEAPAEAQELPSAAPGEQSSNEPAESQGNSLFFFLGSLGVGALGGWWLQRRKKRPQGTLSKLERVGESDESS